MAMAKSGHLRTHQSQWLHSTGLTATGNPSSSSTSTFWVHNSTQMLHRLHHLSKTCMVVRGYLLFFFFTRYLTFVFLDSTKTIPRSFLSVRNTTADYPKWSRSKYILFFWPRGKDFFPFVFAVCIFKGEVECFYCFLFFFQMIKWEKNHGNSLWEIIA